MKKVIKTITAMAFVLCLGATVSAYAGSCPPKCSCVDLNGDGDTTDFGEVICEK